MAKYRDRLPQLGGGTFITDGGMETTMIFHDGLELPHFASFVLLATREGREKTKDYYRRYLEIARRHGTGFVLESSTWRANPDWAARLGYSRQALKAVNEEAIALLAGLRDEYERPGQPIVISGAVGPRGDGYRAGRMDASEAETYHAEQISTFAGTEADMIAAFTMNTVEEAIGVARAAKAHGIPSAISFTVETDGRLATGDGIQGAVETTDAATGGAPAYYMINCAHPSHFDAVLAESGDWVKRIRGIRANASSKSHAELDESETLDAGDPADLGSRYRQLLARMPQLRVLGGCCGTDHRHVAAICEACLTQAA